MVKNTFQLRSTLHPQFIFSCTIGKVFLEFEFPLEFACSEKHDLTFFSGLYKGVSEFTLCMRVRDQSSVKPRVCWRVEAGP